MTFFVPCPSGTCVFDAEVVPRQDDPLLHAVCPEGHDTALAPVVLEHLRRPGFDACGQPDKEGLDP